MSMNQANYVGLTGVRTPDEAEAAVTIFERNGFVPGASHVGMVGVLTAAERRFAGVREATRQVHDPKVMRDIFAAMRGLVLPMMHVELSKTEGNDDTFAAGLARTLEASGVYGADTCRHVQLNGFPAHAEVKALLRDFPHLRLVFQIRKELVARGGEAVVRALEPHGDAFSHALIDPSAGTGAEFDIGNAVDLHDLLRRERPDLALGFAGGFSPDNTRQRVASLVTETGNANWSIDVEGRVRDPETDALDMARFAAYVAAAAEGFRRA